MPSLLLLTSSPRDILPPDNSLPAIQDTYIRAYFDRTIRILAAYPHSACFLPPKRHFQVGDKTSDVVFAHRTLVDHIASQPEPHRTRLQDAFRPEHVRYEISLSLEDFTEDFLHRHLQLLPEEIAWPHVRFQLAPCTRLVRSHWDWDAWLQKEHPGEPEAATVCHVLYRQENQIRIHRLGSFATIVLQAMERPASLTDIMAHITACLDTQDRPGPRWLRDQVMSQLTVAYQQGILRCVAESPTPHPGAFV